MTGRSMPSDGMTTRVTTAAGRADGMATGVGREVAGVVVGRPEGTIVGGGGGADRAGDPFGRGVKVAEGAASADADGRDPCPSPMAGAAYESRPTVRSVTPAAMSSDGTTRSRRGIRRMGRWMLPARGASPAAIG